MRRGARWPAPTCPNPSAPTWPPQPPDRLPWREATYTVLDLETTGLDPATDVIVAAGGLRVVGGRAAAATAFRLLARPDRAVPAEAIRIHGLLPELAAAPPLAEQLTALLDRTVGDVLVVHVAEVDQAFLDAAMRRLWGCPLNATVLDTARMAAALNRRLDLARPPGRRPGTSCAWPTWPGPTGCRSTPSTTRSTTPSPPPNCSSPWPPGWNGTGAAPSGPCAASPAEHEAHGQRPGPARAIATGVKEIKAFGEASEQLALFEQASTNTEVTQLGADRGLAGECHGVSPFKGVPAQPVVNANARTTMEGSAVTGPISAPRRSCATSRTAVWLVATACNRASNTDNSPARYCCVITAAQSLSPASSRDLERLNGIAGNHTTTA